MPRVFSEKETRDVIRRFERGDSVDLIAFALSCDKKPIARLLREKGLSSAARRRKQQAEWAWKGKK